MSQAQYSYAPAPRETNGLGIAGFVCSLVGLLATGGLLCPVGLILSLIAIGRRPRGFAVAGLILGLVGSCGWIIAFFVFGAVLLAMMATALGLAVAVALTEPEKMEITGDMANMAVAIALYEEENKYLPADLETLGLRPTVLRDPWGTPYQYHLTNEDPGFDLVSAGADLQFGTLDDVRLTTLGETWEAGGFNVNVTEDDAGRVKISIGDRTITAGGDDDGQRA